MNRKEFIRDHYSKFWLNARETRYGFPVHNKSVCDYVASHTPDGGKILDVGVGTGNPHADYLQQQGFTVHGIDLAPLLIEKCQRLYPKVQSVVGDAEDLPYPDNCFDSVYSISSTKYFPDIEKAIGEMVRVVKPKGLAVFDLLNAYNEKVQTLYQGRLRGGTLPARIKRWLLRKPYVVYETPSYPTSVYSLLGTLGVTGFKVATSDSKDSPMELQNHLGLFSERTTIVFVVTK